MNYNEVFVNKSKIDSLLRQSIEISLFLSRIILRLKKILQITITMTLMKNKQCQEFCMTIPQNQIKVQRFNSEKFAEKIYFHRLRK